MTREEQIKKQSDNYSDNSSNYTEWSDSWQDLNDIEYIERAFETGAKWADENPNWHCIADGDLPSIGICVAVTNIKSNLRKVYIEYVDIDSDINYIRRNMTHWMEIKLPNNK